MPTFLKKKKNIHVRYPKLVHGTVEFKQRLLLFSFREKTEMLSCAYKRVWRPDYYLALVILVNIKYVIFAYTSGETHDPNFDTTLTPNLALESPDHTVTAQTWNTDMCSQLRLNFRTPHKSEIITTTTALLYILTTRRNSVISSGSTDRTGHWSTARIPLTKIANF